MKTINTKIIGITIAMICNIHTIRNISFCYLWDPQPREGLRMDNVHELIFQILNYAALFILCPCSCQHYHFYTFFSCTINRLQESWFFYNPNSAQNYTQCSLEKQISQGSINGLTYDPTSHLHIYSLQLLCMVSLLSFYQLLMLMALSKEKVICKILGYK